jgi:hypothetical protein
VVGPEFIPYNNGAIVLEQPHEIRDRAISGCEQPKPMANRLSLPPIEWRTWSKSGSETACQRNARRPRRRYESEARRNLLPALGSKRVRELKPAHVQAFVNRLEHKSLSPRTVRYNHAILRACWRWAW